MFVSRRYHTPLLFFMIVSAAILCCTRASASAEDEKPYIEIFDQAALDIIEPDARINILGSGYVWSEGPVWVASEGFLLFSDVPENKIYKYEPGKGVSLYLEPSGSTGIDKTDSAAGSNGLELDKQNRLVLMQHGDRRVARMDAPLNAPKASFISIATHYDNKRLNSPNDAVYHSNGDLYFTDPPYGLAGGRNSPHKSLPFDGVFRVTKDGEVLLIDNSFDYPNGIALSTDEKKLFVAASDRNAARIYHYDVTENGSVENKKIFYDATHLVGKADEKGLPDGMVVHSEGYLFATGPGGVFVFTQEGKLLAKIRTGKATANCTLSDDESVLYMTAHDTLMSVTLK